MKRHLLRILLIVSFTLFCATELLWAASQLTWSWQTRFLGAWQMPYPWSWRIRYPADGLNFVTLVSKSNYVCAFEATEDSIQFRAVKPIAPGTIPELRASAYERFYKQYYGRAFTCEFLGHRFRYGPYITYVGNNPTNPLVCSMEHAVKLPYWSILVITSIWPLWRTWVFAGRRRKEHLLRSGLCPTCDYDLRASKDRCPECGTSIDMSRVQAVPNKPLGVLPLGCVLTAGYVAVSIMILAISAPCMKALAVPQTARETVWGIIVPLWLLFHVLGREVSLVPLLLPNGLIVGFASACVIGRIRQWRTRRATGV